MVYLVESKRGKKSYFYLVENIRVSKGERKQFRSYLGSVKPSSSRLDILVSGFKKEVENEKQKLFGFHYLFPGEIREVDAINSEFKKRYAALNPVEKEQFNQNFVNVFVYNSNSIEGSTLTAREVALLLEENISPNRPLEDVLEAKSAQRVLQYIKSIKTELNQKLFLKLHEMYFKDSKPFIAGRFKTKDNVVIRSGGTKFKTTPAIFVLTDLKILFEEHKKMKKELHPLELAAWVHWKFETIHPFQDGNGRVGRILMNYILFKNDYQMIDIKTREKQQYFNALTKCDKENSAEPLARLLVKRFKKQYKNALR